MIFKVNPSKDNLVFLYGINKGCIKDGKSHDFSQGNRVYSPKGKATTITAEGGGLGGKTGLYEVKDYKLRRLTPGECSRLQTIPEWYKWIVSDTQIYRMLGNGWTVEVIKHILSFLPKEYFNQ